MKLLKCNMNDSCFCEKPICNDIMKIKELYSIANDNKCILFCGLIEDLIQFTTIIS